MAAFLIHSIEENTSNTTRFLAMFDIEIIIGPLLKFWIKCRVSAYRKWFSKPL
jgi:hypothetical protein